MPNADEIRDFLREQIKSAMYMAEDELDSDALFSSFGLESTTLTKIVSSINESYNTKIQPKDILPYQSVNKATDAIVKLLEVETA